MKLHSWNWKFKEVETINYQKSPIQTMDDKASSALIIPDTAIKIHLNKFWGRGLSENEKNPIGHCQNSLGALEIGDAKGRSGSIKLIVLLS